MIKINLAKRKQMNVAPVSMGTGSNIKSSSEAKGPSIFSRFGESLSSSIDSSGIVVLLTRVVIPVVISVVAYFFYNQYVSERRAEMASELQQITLDKSKIQGELNRIAGFEVLKVELEQNEKILNNKIETIQKLIANRDFAFKSLISLSNSLPREVWIHELVENEQGFEIKGNATEVGLVGDLMTRLGQTPYFKEIALKSTAQDAALNQATFELSARRE